MTFSWRRWNNSIHRDLGYLCVGLTVIYALSGLAVNHIADWNPSYRLERIVSSIDLNSIRGRELAETVPIILEQLGEEGELKNYLLMDADTLLIFVVNNNITVDLPSGEVRQEKSIPRKVLYAMNFLHLNHAKKLWTYIADLYALALTILAITGLFMRRGKMGLAGRGAWLAAAGAIIPLLFLWLYS